MGTPRWKPSVTVAAVVEQGGRYLLVEEMTADGLRLNNPAGHLDPGESLLTAVAREALEETACPFRPEALLGVYLARLQRPALAPSAPSVLGAAGGAALAPLHDDESDITYLRFAFSGAVGERIPGRALDAPVVRTLWMTPEEVRASAGRHRSPLVLRCVEDHLAGRRFPLDLLATEPSVQALQGLAATLEPTSPGPGDAGPVEPRP